MIKIIRPPAPTFFESPKLLKVKDDLARRFVDADRQERLRFDISILKTIKPDLLQMCNGKCAYCETELGTKEYGDIENFRPKAGARGLNKNMYAPAHYWWLAYEWENLLISCQICNQKYKRDFFPLDNESDRAAIGAMGDELLGEGALLVDPVVDNPGDHIEFDESGYARELSKKGKVTIEIIGLNRPELAERRRNRADELRIRLNSIYSVKNIAGSFVKKLVADINELLSETTRQEYAGMQRDIFFSWHDANPEIWDEAKRVQQDESETARTDKPDLVSPDDLASQVSQVEEQLSTIKRFSIKSVTIKNFRSIESLTLNMQPPRATDQESQESWLLLLGDNGIGKSSILQAIALALSTRAQLDRLNLDVTDYLKRDTDKGQVIVNSYESDKPITLSYDKTGFHTELNEAPAFVLAYGSTRLLPKGGVQPEKTRLPFLNIHNLFDYSIALNDPNAWLAKVNPIEFEERIAPAFFDVLALRGDDRVSVDDKGKVRIKQFGEDHELEDNSDGYKTIAALVADIMQTLSIEKASYHNSYGIVMVDEIGNHLHPRWRLKIASALRRAFPKLQFIVTTHEPLCLRGLLKGEVVVMVRDQLNKIKALDGDLLPDHTLLRIDQLLTSDLFGLVNVDDEETEKTYEQYYDLLSKPPERRTADDEARIEHFSTTLAGREVLGSTPDMQILFRLVNETYAQKLRDEGFKTREDLKEETLTEVEKILSKGGFDWL